MMKWLTAELVDRNTTDEGVQSTILMTEPNGDQHRMQCICRQDGTTDLRESDEGSQIDYLNERYGPQVVCALSRFVALGPDGRSPFATL